MKVGIIALLVCSLCTATHGSITEELYNQCYTHGIEQVKQGNLEAARLSFEQALAIKPGDTNAEKALHLIEDRTKQATVDSSPSYEQKERTWAEPAPSRNQGIKKPASSGFGLRVSFGSAPGIDDADAPPIGSGSIDDDGGVQFEVLAVKRFWSGDDSNPLGALLGGGVFFAGHDAEELGVTFDLAAAGIMGQAGGALRLGEYVVIEVAPYLGFGAGIADSNLLDEEAGAAYYMYGIKGGIFVLLGGSVELGVEAGYHGFSSDFEVEDSFSSATYDWSCSGSGPRVSAVLGIQF